ncbi:MAG TPA: hypothetical protein VFW77_02470 [Candidatus Saccharimonadales bacterium]|nr:hypothetical protein [Candidatus Saccharimonadales bacterium]
MNDGQNQNSTYTQPQESSGGIQSQSASVPATNANVQGQDADLFGNSMDTTTLLNQTQVLGTDTQTTSQVPSTTTGVSTVGNKDQGVLTPLNIAIIIAALLLLAGLFKLVDRRNGPAD